jgi:hypothetical protein
LGWPAHSDDIPEKVLIHWIIIKEPNKFTKSKGRIFILVETAGEPKSNLLARFFGYRKEKVEPRLHGIKYNRGLHEELEKNVIPRLKQGQPVAGNFKKSEKGKGISKKGEAKADEKGDRSESQEQDWEFHELRPSDIHKKPTR